MGIGLWCTLNGGSDPFGDAVRSYTLEEALDSIAASPIKRVSAHDRDLYRDDASPLVIERELGALKMMMDERGLLPHNFTANNFSDPAFATGAFSSPFTAVVEAAIAKGIRAMDAANIFGARNLIFWGGREGTDGAYEQDPGIAVRNYVHGKKVCIKYAIAKGYTFNFTDEPKAYEPRLLALYLGTGGSAASAIRHFFPELEYSGRIKIGPEYPQHTSIVCMDPVIELGQLIEENMLADYIHFGGQIPGRMDCDLPPGWGGNFYQDFMICKTLHERGWDGTIELDCRPPRTTKTVQGLCRFINRAAEYWQTLEDKVEIYFKDPIVQEMKAQMTMIPSDALSAVYSALIGENNILEAVKALPDVKTALEAARVVDSDIIEAYQARVADIVMGKV